MNRDLLDFDVLVSVTARISQPVGVSDRDLCHEHGGESKKRLSCGRRTEPRGGALSLQ
jgi:hypothetical protein